MDNEQLRREVMAGCEKILNGPRLFITREDRRLAAAQLQFWRTATDADLSRLAALLPAQAPEHPPADPAPDAVHLAALAAARSMRDRASRTALQHSVIPCAWVCNAISTDIDKLPLLEE